MAEKTFSRRERGRPRNPDVFPKILAAAKKLLASDGYEALTYDALAQSTGVSRGTIYRRWPTKAHIAADIIRGNEEGFTYTPLEEGFSAQIRAVVEQIYSGYKDPAMGPASVGLFNAYFTDASLRSTVHDPLEEGARENFRKIVNDAKRSGTARKDIDVDALFDILTGSIIYRILFSNLSCDDRHIEEICNIVINGVLADS
ncbi:hypothetical protein MB02_12620 [Croceicoccus estronivorus]|uniref:TetR/AcrR family transcriptional regulator n=1 Tax=Croceicoccus estronivorus TaxID=1172626 RepID=UPI00082EB073|nr:TetR/AcrR family transcriptional regulator [Croceicoccus estronivorus]OCC23444.1 hypothetical protein MB02_12620 [Croceicoccus estronivorus]